jgi:hypothetical protein
MSDTLWLICLLVGIVFGIINLVLLLRTTSLWGGLLALIGLLGSIVCVGFGLGHLLGLQ